MPPTTTPPTTGRRHNIDPAFADLPLRNLADAALGAATAAGASFADFRFERLVTGRSDHPRHRGAVGHRCDHHRLRGAGDRRRDRGVSRLGRRRPPDEAAATARQAVAVARALAGVVAERVERADEPVLPRRHLDQRVPHRPVRRPGRRTRSRCCSTGPSGCWPPTGSRTRTAGLFQVKENKFYADTAGTDDHPAAGPAAADAHRHRGRLRDRRVRDHVQPRPRRSAAARST